jgi:hypothetical protein
MRTRARAGGRMKRRSGIVRRLAAPDSASAASERCRGRKPQERRSTMEPAPVFGTLSAGIAARAGRAGRAEIAGRARSALRASIDSMWQGGRGPRTPKRTQQSQ